MSVLRRAGGTLLIASAFPGQRRMPFRTRERVHRLRDARVRALVGFAATTVPHYRDLFRDPRIDPRALRTADDLASLPLLDKDAVQRDPARFRPDEPAGPTLALRTTGSTAMPLEVVHDRRSTLLNIAYGERERAVEARLAGGARYLAVDVRAPAGTASRVQEFYAREAFRPGRPRSQRLGVGTPIDDLLATFDRLRPDVVRSYGTYLELLFRTALARSRPFHRPRAVVYSGDTMSSGGRELLEALGIAVLSRYNAVECFKIAYTCEQRTGFHLHEDLCHVRLVDARGDDVAPGERGEVAISNLVNRGTVLLNYRLGDIARLDPRPCACGRTAPRLVDLEGRVDEVIDLGGGEFVYPTEVWQTLRDRPEILRYQLVQRSDAEFDLRVVTATGEPHGLAAADAAAADLRRLLRGARVDAVAVADLPAGPGGKFRHLVPLRGPTSATAGIGPPESR